MIYQTNLQNKSISKLGFGCMRFPKIDPEKPDIDRELAFDMIDLAYKQGVTYFDTAYPYHNGLSEPFVGEALKRYDRSSFALATKMPLWSVTSKEHAREIFFEQLARLQVEYIDYYLMHNMNRDNYQKAIEHDVIALCLELKEQGYIKNLGFSFHDSVEVLQSHLKNHQWDFVQLQLNYLDWELQNAKTQYELVSSYHIPVIVMEPVRGGMLANLGEKANQVFQTIHPDKSIASWAIRYAASLPNVMTVLSGMSDMNQVKDNLYTMQSFTPLTAFEYEAIEKVLSIHRASGVIPCTGCRYCMDCPYGVDIPRVFSIYNQYKIKEDKWMFSNSYERVLEDSKKASQCVKCGSCLPKCPQAIDIPTWMDNINQEVKSLFEKK